MTSTSAAASVGALAHGLVDACRRDGVDLRPDLRLLSGASPRRSDAVTVDSPWDLGPAHERLTSSAERTRRGAWYTPRATAEELVATTIDSIGTVFDPACGGGVFLLAAAERLVALGADPREVIDSVSGADVDPVAVAVAEAALWWWGTGHGVDRVPARLAVADSLLGPAWPRVHYVVGNPPFLGQLRSATSAAQPRRAALRERFGAAVGAYTDPAALFLLAAVDAVDDAGAVTLIQPRSVLGSRDTGTLRSHIDAVAEVESCWFGDAGTFDASVEVCAPTLRRRDRDQPADSTRPWTSWLADHLGIPDVDLGPGPTFASVATVFAGFRDQYYGLVEAVTEGGDGPRLVTSGAIDPFVVRSDKPVSFAKTRWADPRIDLSRVASTAVGWVQRQLEPSVLVASQTRIVECVVDAVGDTVVGVPGVVAVPTKDVDVWHMAASLGAPGVSAWMARRSVGTGMSPESFRLTAASVGSVAIPRNGEEWDRAAELARRITEGDMGEDTWLSFAVAANAAYDIDDDNLVEWWWNRHPGRRSS